MACHRTTARSTFLIVLGLLAGVGAQTADAVDRGDDAGATRKAQAGGVLPPEPVRPAPAAAPKPKAKPKPKPKPQGKRLIFPIVGPVQYTNDFGAPRSGGVSHQGNDLMAPKRSLAVAVEDGTVKLAGGGRAGCYLYLYGKSKTVYLYIHLNNDLTKGNDNRGRCVGGVAYARGLKTGSKVRAGEPVGYVGDSGDANGVASHLHFEVHPRGGSAVSPYPYLNRAIRLLFAARRGSRFTLSLKGTIAGAAPEQLTQRVSTLRAYPGGPVFPKVNRTIRLLVPTSALVERMTNGIARAVAAPLAALKKKLPVQTWTSPARTTLEAQMGVDGSLIAERILIR